MTRTLLLGLLLAAAARAGELELPVVEATLDNGLKVLVLEDHDIPNCALYVTWRVGSRNEVTGITGLAHFFEHMMFTGGAKYGKSFDPTMEAAGGSNNAYTTKDVTVYQDWFPSAKLPLMLDMEADRMRGMVFDPKVVASEREVVTSEYRLAMEEPASVMYEQLGAAAYTAHPYQWDVLGWLSDIESWEKEDLETFFARNYAPNNATLVLVGDVDAAAAHALVKEKLGPIPRKPERRPLHTREPVQKGERRVVVRHPSATVSQFMVAWHMCATPDPEFAVFEILEYVLLDGESSRLHRLLVEEQGACLSIYNLGGWQGLQFDPSLFVIDGEMREGVPTARAEELVYGALDKLAKEGPTEAELAKAKNRLKASLLRRLKTINGKAGLLSETETFFGGWRNLPARLDRIDAVTASDVKRVVAKTFTAENRTVCTLEVEP